MFKEIKTGISQALDAISGGEYEISVEQTHQDLEYHTFYIDEVNTIGTMLAGRRFKLSVSFDILFYLSPEDKQDFVDQIKENMYEALQIIEVDGKKVRRGDATVNVVDRVMHFSVAYEMNLLVEAENIETMAELMDKLQLKK